MNQRAVTFGSDTPVNLKAGELAVDPGGDYVVTPSGSQPLAPNLTAFAGLAGLADRVPYFTAAAALALATFTAFGRSLVAAVDAAAAKALLVLAKADVGLGNVDNTSDANKPVSTAQAAADALRLLLTGGSLTGALGINRSGGAINATDLHAGAGDYTLDGAVSVRYEPVVSSPGNYARTQWFHPKYTGNVGQNAIALQVVPELAAGKTCPAMYGVAVTHINAAAAGKFVGVWVYAAGGVAPTTNYDAIFDGGGNVGVGTAAPTARLHVNGTLKADTSLAIGGGTALTKAVVYTPTLTPANVAANTTAEEAFTVTGLATGDTIAVAVPGVAAGVGLVGARVSAANTLALTFGNFTAGPLAPPAGVYRILAVRS